MPRKPKVSRFHEPLIAMGFQCASSGTDYYRTFLGLPDGALLAVNLSVRDNLLYGDFQGGREGLTDGYTEMALPAVLTYIARYSAQLAEQDLQRKLRGALGL